jgi:hypothetical protein
VDLSRLYTVGANVQHENILSLCTRKETRRAAQDTSKYGYVLKITEKGKKQEKQQRRLYIMLFCLQG